MGSVAVLAPQVSCTALYLHSAMSTCFQLGLTSIRLTTLAAPVFMLLLLEGTFSPSQALRRDLAKGVGPSLLPRCLPLSRQKGLSGAVLPLPLPVPVASP